MKRSLAALPVLAVVLASWPLALSAQQAAQQDQAAFKAMVEANAVVQEKVMVPMRDGTRMAADVFRPKGDGPFPIIFSRTPYNFNS